MRLVKSSLFLLGQIFAICFLFAVPAASHYDSPHTCIHDKLKYTPELLELPDEDDAEGRMLQAYQNIRIYFDFTKLTTASKQFRDYITNVIIPPCKNYLEAALKVKPFADNLTCKGYSTICDGAIKVPSIYSTEGVPADLVIFVDLVHDIATDFVAYTVPCMLSTLNNRPLFGRLVFNTAMVQSSTNNVRIERDITATLHETTHALGFSGILFAFFSNPVTNKVLKGHLFQKLVNGVNTTVINVEPLTTRLRNHFGCPNLEGAYLENEGNPGSTGVHFERRILNNEYMTASTMKDTKVTEFTLALLEGSGWYQVDYSLAEPITWGKNKGCSFLNGPCINSTTKKTNFDEFCSPLGSLGCSWTGRGASVCGSSMSRTKANLPAAFNYWGNKTVVNDQFADNCPTRDIFVNLDCEDEAIQKKALLPKHEFYGYEGKCFMGTLAPTGIDIPPYFYCFRPTCERQPDGKFIMKVKVGNNTVTCKSESKISVKGLSGKLFCPDPNQYCNQITSEGFCRRGCFGRGTCIDKKCQCVDGWGNHDCSKKIYKDQCKRCEGDPFRTSCYGDLCECNPKNGTCVKALESNTISIATFASKEVALEEEAFKETQETWSTSSVDNDDTPLKTNENSQQSESTIDQTGDDDSQKFLSKKTTDALNDEKKPTFGNSSENNSTIYKSDESMQDSDNNEVVFRENNEDHVPVENSTGSINSQPDSSAGDNADINNEEVLSEQDESNGVKANETFNSLDSKTENGSLNESNASFSEDTNSNHDNEEDSPQNKQDLNTQSKENKGLNNPETESLKTETAPSEDRSPSSQEEKNISISNSIYDKNSLDSKIALSEARKLLGNRVKLVALMIVYIIFH